MILTNNMSRLRDLRTTNFTETATTPKISVKRFVKRKILFIYLLTSLPIYLSIYLLSIYLCRVPAVPDRGADDLWERGDKDSPVQPAGSTAGGGELIPEQDQGNVL